MATFETSKLLIIPLINHQNQPLDRISASLNTLCNGFSCTSIWNKDLKNSLEQPPWYLNAKNHITYLHFCSSFRCCTARFLLSALHLAAPLPHNHPASNNNTHSQTKENDTKISMLSNTIASPFCDLPCLHVVENKYYQLPTKKNMLLEKP